MTRYLIVNADDFGQSTGVNEGIIAAYEQGIVTSASLMTRWPAATHAVAYARANPDLSLGLHVDLGEWTYRDESWIPLYEVVPTNDKDAVAKEVSNQLATFRHLTGREPTHLDSHQHVHRHEPARSVLRALAHDLNIPLRHYSSVVRYCGDFYGQASRAAPCSEAIGVPRLIELVTALPAGFTELGCHPGHPYDLTSSYLQERYIEVRTLCDPEVGHAIKQAQIRLCSFADVTSKEAHTG